MSSQPDPGTGASSNATDDLLARAAAAYRAGALNDAEVLYRRILDRDPGNPFALHGVGVIAYRVNQDELAIDYMDRAVRGRPDAVLYHDDIATALRRLGRPRDAIEAFDRAMALDPDNASRYYALGGLYNSIERCEEAARCFERVVALDPGRAGAHNDLGSAYRELGRVDDAERHYRQALALAPGMAAAHNNIAVLLKERGRLDEALSHGRQALKLNPKFQEGHNTLALIHYERGELETAESHFREAIALQPGYPAAHSNLTIVLVDLHRFEEAEHHCRTALRLGPSFAAAHANMGMLLHVRGDVRQAIRWYERSLELSPKEASARFNRALAVLQLQDYREGWASYDHGFRARQRTERRFGLPDWNGHPIGDKGVLVYAEQGVGDEIMFASCIPDLVERAGQCVIECDPRLAPLFARSFSGAEVRGLRRDADASWISERGGLDYQVAIGSLPRFFRNDAGSFPDRSAYLRADPARVEHWHARLGALGSGPHIGISWRGGRRARERSERSMVLDDWARLLGSVDASFVNLQYGPTAEDIAALQAGRSVRVHAFPEIDPLRELDEFAALICALDLVVSVDNSTVHLAGALGVPTVVLLPYVPDWRWQLARADTPWYRSVRLLRQPSWGQWEPVLEQACEALTALAGRTSHSPAHDDSMAAERAEAQRLAGELDAAVRSYREALELDPGNVPVRLSLGEALRDLGRDYEALDVLQAAVADAPDSAAVRIALARTLRRIAHLEALSDLFRAGPGLRARIAQCALPGDPVLSAPSRIDVVLAQPGAEEPGLVRARARLEQALEHCCRAVDAAPEWEPALRAAGEMLIDLDRGGEAQEWLERAVSLQPRRLAPRLRQGTARVLSGDPGGAEECCRTALSLEPDNADALFHLGLITLAQGRYAEGWRLYSARKRLPAFAPRAHFPFPDWGGEALDGRRILIFAEQGLGEEIQFASCIPDLASRAEACVVECDPRLAPLLRRSFPAARVEGRRRDDGILWLWGLPEVHVQAPIGDLPGFLRREADDFPARQGYLMADQAARALWRRRLGRRGAGPKIGVSWRGGRSPGDQWRRAIDPAALGALAAVPGGDDAVWVSCQYGSRPLERERFTEAAGRPLNHWDDPDPLVDLDGFAALVSALDLVITADNTTAHLAAALGVPTWILLPASCDWRWGTAGTHTPWYAAARLFRQPGPGAWDEVLRAVAHDLSSVPRARRRKGRGGERR